MRTTLEGLIQSVAQDGLPDMDSGEYTGRVAFIFDGGIYSGWPVPGELDEEGRTLWEADEAHLRTFDVEHWIEWREPLWEIFRASRGEEP